MRSDVVMIEPMGFGGITHYTYALCEALAAGGRRVSLVTTRNYEMAGRPRKFQLHPILHVWFRPDASDKVSKTTMWGVAWRRLRSTFTMLRIIGIVLAERASVVHLQWPIGPHDWMYLAALRRLGRRVVYTAHDVVPHEHSHEDVVRLRRLLREVDEIILHSEENARAFRELFSQVAPQPRVIPHGNYMFFPEAAQQPPRPAREVVGVPPDALVVLFFGAIRPYKGLLDLIRAFGHVRQRLPRAWLVVAGYPYEDFAPYQDALDAAGLESCAKLHLGYHPVGAVANFFRAADVVVLPYRSASQSGVTHLAFAFGLPTIATRVGGLPEIVEDERTGLLVAPGDERAMAHAMIRLLTDAHLRRVMGARAAEVAASRYSWDGIAKKTLDIYNIDRGVGNPRLLSPE